MTATRLINKWQNHDFNIPGPDDGEQYGDFSGFKEFCVDFQDYLKEICYKNKLEIVWFTPCSYGWTTCLKSNKTNQHYYISACDVRLFQNEWRDNILYRTMSHDKDYCGGHNNYSTLKDLEQNLINMDKRIEKRKEIER